MNLDKNGRELKAGQLVRLCGTHHNYLVPEYRMLTACGPCLHLGEEPLQDFRNGDTEYHALEIVE